MSGLLPLLCQRPDGHPFLQPISSTKVTHADLVAAVEVDEQSTFMTSSQKKQATHKCLPKNWITSLPEEDHEWVSSSFFHYNERGHVKFNMRRVNKLWWHPPQPALSPRRPSVSSYVNHRLFLWMPRRLWNCRLLCSQGHELTSAGIYTKNVRRVVDVDSCYFMAAEYLECSTCKCKFISYEQRILDQLDIAHRQEFQVVLTNRLACDLKVVRLLRQRTLGNGPAQLRRSLLEQHTETYYCKLARFWTDFQKVRAGLGAAAMSKVDPSSIPPMLPVPDIKWLQQVYARDVIDSLEEVKASITSTFGSVLKVDSTKKLDAFHLSKIVKKLAGADAYTATWQTSVGNEHGQVLTSVVTTSKGLDLETMVLGLIKRYRDAGVAAPKLLYLDSDCCGTGGIKEIFLGAWPDLEVRLDIWHFMRHLARGVTTDAHPLYAKFMGEISTAVFCWDAEDLKALKNAKRLDLMQQGHPDLDHNAIMAAITRKELGLHCRRQTRSSEEVLTLLRAVIDNFLSAKDTLGVPLLDAERMELIWSEQKKHIACIQDPPDFALYMRTGTIKKGGVKLATYRCARGSTSLESFHLHLNRFIPGTSVNALHYQLYLLEGLRRWNQDREGEATGSASASSLCYSGLLMHSLNTLSVAATGKAFFENFSPPRKYTGELLGMEYLGQQAASRIQECLRLQLSSDSEVEADEGFANLHCEEYEDLTLPVQVSEAMGVSSEPDHIPKMITEPALVPSQDQTGFHTSVVVSGPSSPFPGPSGTPAALFDDDDDTVWPDNIPGDEKVQCLAKLLVDLRLASFVSSNQMEAIVKAYNNLDDFDKRPTAFPQRFTHKLDTSSFRRSKTAMAPGVESTKRCFLGANTGPAQSPGINRISEAVYDQLCRLIPSYRTERQEGKKARVIPRFLLIVESYSNIRRLVYSNAQLTSQIKLQLADINQMTLSQCFHNRQEKMERAVLHAGMPDFNPPMASAVSLPPAQSPPASLDTGTEAEAHSCILPENTAGTAMLGKRRKQAPLLAKPQPIILRQAGPLPFCYFVPPSAFCSGSVPIFFKMPTAPLATIQPPVTLSPWPVTAQAPAPPPLVAPATTTVNKPSRTTEWRRRKRLQEVSGQSGKRPRKETMTCRSCNQERLPGTHGQYFGVWWCGNSSTATFEEFKEEQMKSRTIKKKMQ